MTRAPHPGSARRRGRWERGREGFASSRPWPVVTAALVLAALGLHALGAGPALEWSRARLGGEVGAGELFRLWTGHLVHWSHAHLAWDVLALGVLGAWLERRGGRLRMGALLVAAATAISLVLRALEPDLARYRGLSGLDAALFALVCTILLRDALAARDRLGAGAAGLLLLGLAAKIAFEQATGTAAFVPTTGPAEVVPLAHVVGATLGVAAGLGRRNQCAEGPGRGRPRRREERHCLPLGPLRRNWRGRHVRVISAALHACCDSPRCPGTGGP